MTNKAKELKNIADKKSTEDANLMIENRLDEYLAHAQKGYTTYTEELHLYRKSTMKKFFKILRSYGFKVRKRKIKTSKHNRVYGWCSYKIVIKW